MLIGEEVLFKLFSVRNKRTKMRDEKGNPLIDSTKVLFLAV